MAWNGSKNMVNRRSSRGVLQFSIMEVSVNKLHVSYDRLDTYIIQPCITKARIPPPFLGEVRGKEFLGVQETKDRTNLRGELLVLLCIL